MICKFSVHAHDGDDAPAHLRALLDDLRSWREYYIEFADVPDDATLAAIAGDLGDPVLERVVRDQPLPVGAVQVAYQRSIVDNENDSIVTLCGLHGADAAWAKVATAYASDDPALAKIIGEHATNHNIEALHTSEPALASLGPTGSYAPAEHVDLRELDDTALAAVGRANGRSLDLDQMRHVRSIQIASDTDTVTDALLEALDARWSDHCAHTTWTSLGKLLRRLIDAAKATENPNVVSMFHDNAGVWDFFDGEAIAVKAETHNGPSAVSAYFGQLTKIGGVLRDILGTGRGADPIGVFEYTATGVPGTPSPTEGRPEPRRIATETIRAVKEYGNTFGVPMMSSHMTFHPAYRAKPFALGGSIGLVPTEHAQRGTPQPGDLAVLIGGLTGNDGIHGASASSAGAEAMEATAVQIGSPLEEIAFREAILDLRDGGCLRAVTDLGAAGINSAVGEMGDPVGVWCNTACVPLKTAGLPMWRILLSESQERMLLAVPHDRLEAAAAVLDRHQVRNAVIGVFTGDGHYCVVHDPDIGADDIVAAATAAGGPRPAATPAEVGFDVTYDVLDWTPPARDVDNPPPTPEPIDDWSAVADLVTTAAATFADPEVADQSFASDQYDSTVQGRTFYGPFAGSDDRVATGISVLRPIRSSRAGVVFSTGFNPWLFEIDPVHAARQAVLGALARQAVAGVARRDVCLCDNFYTPHLEPDADAWLVAMVDELAALSRVLGTPFISGKDSSAGSTVTDEGTISVPPAVFVSALGKTPDVDRLRLEPLTAPGHQLVLVGPRTPARAGTAAARALGLEPGGVDDVDVPGALAFLDAMAALDHRTVPSGRVIEPGGVVATAFLGARPLGLTAALTGGGELFAEHRAGALLEVAPDAVADLPADLDPVVVGAVVDDGDRGGTVRVDGAVVTTDEVRTRWSRSFEEVVR